MAAATKIPGVTSKTKDAADTAPKRSAPDTGGQVMHEHVFERLSEAIMSGAMAPGRAISVRRLASDFGVSAMPAREAIRRLVALGALELTDTRRIMIARMNSEKFTEIKFARLALEPQLAGLALKAVADKPREKKRLLRALKETDGAQDRSIDAGEVTDYARFNKDFHFALYRASNASILVGLVESLWLQFGPFMRMVLGRLGTSYIVDDQHKTIISAVENNDFDRIEEAVREDILQGMEHIKKSDFDAPL